MSSIKASDKSCVAEDARLVLPAEGVTPPSSALASCSVLLPTFQARVACLPRFYQLSFSQLLVDVSFDAITHLPLPCCSPHISFLSAALPLPRVCHLP